VIRLRVSYHQTDGTLSRNSLKKFTHSGSLVAAGHLSVCMLIYPRPWVARQNAAAPTGGAFKFASRLFTYIYMYTICVCISAQGGGAPNLVLRLFTSTYTIRLNIIPLLVAPQGCSHTGGTPNPRLPSIYVYIYI